MKKLAFLAILALVAGAAGVQAQVIPQPGPPTPIGCAYHTSPVTLTDNQAGWVQCDSAGKLQVNASVSASISGFQPAATGTPIAVTTGGVTGTLPAGTVVTAFNVGTSNTAYCKLGATATTSDIAIPPQSWFAYTVGAATQMTCITSTSTTTVNMVGGSGLPTGAGGGGGGGVASTVNQGTAGSSAWLAAISNAGGTTQAQVVANSDALANQAGVSANAQNQVYNGTTWDRMREATADAMAVTGLQGAANMMYNGTTWDRIRGDTTNGIWVNVKAITGQNANGQATMANSAPVVTASDQKISTATSSAAINISTATTTQLVPLSGSTKIYVLNWNVVAGGTGNITLVYGTGTNCGTGTTSLTGAYNLTAQAGLAPSGGAGPVLVVPAGNALCATTSAAVQMSGSVAYQQF